MLAHERVPRGGDEDRVEPAVARLLDEGRGMEDVGVAAGAAPQLPETAELPVALANQEVVAVPALQLEEAAGAGERVVARKAQDDAASGRGLQGVVPVVPTRATSAGTNQAAGSPNALSAGSVNAIRVA